MSSASKLLSASLNQDASCAAIGTEDGFRVYSLEPFSEMFRRVFTNGGVGIAEMLFKCQIFALVGGGSLPKYPLNKVMIWDDAAGRAIGELSFRSQVRSVRLRKDRIAVALEHKVLVYNFADLRLMHTIETLSNPAGLLAVSPSADHAVLACLGLHGGQVRVEQYDTRRTRFVQAHDSGVQALALSENGKLLATASEKGTLIRVFATAEGTKLQELRRGFDPACIYSVAFSRGPTPEWVAATSDKGTAHVFSLRQAGGGSGSGGSGGGGGAGQSGEGELASSPSRANPTSALSFVSTYLPVGGKYFSSERSFAQFRLPDACRVAVGFGREPNTLLLVSTAGCFYRLSFDGERGGQCEQTAFAQFMEESPSP